MTKQLSNNDVRVEMSVDAPVEKAYSVFTEGIDTWWPRSHHIGKGVLAQEIIEPRAGGRCYGVEADGTECSWGTVLEWDPPRKFAFTWAIDLNWQYETDQAKASRVDVTFTPDGPNRTTVLLVHSGFDRHGDGWEAMRESVSSPGGWPDLANTFAKAAAS